MQTGGVRGLGAQGFRSPSPLSRPTSPPPQVEKRMSESHMIIKMQKTYIYVYVHAYIHKYTCAYTKMVSVGPKLSNLHIHNYDVMLCWLIQADCDFSLLNTLLYGLGTPFRLRSIGALMVRIRFWEFLWFTDKGTIWEYYESFFRPLY